MQQFVRVQQSGTSDRGLLDLRPLISDITPGIIGGGVLAQVNAPNLRTISGDVRYLAPIRAIRQVRATGFNYKKHIEELRVPTPTEPEVFLKSTLSVTGPCDPIRRGPNAGVKLDWGTELAIVVGREAQDPSDRCIANNPLYCNQSLREYLWNLKPSWFRLVKATRSVHVSS